MSNVSNLKQTGVTTGAMTDAEVIEVLRNSLYPGASDGSIKLVVGYCKAAGLDPMQKPVHIVPMYVKEAGSKSGTMRDVVMPGIGLYRTQAARGGQYAGVTEPEFGPDVNETLSGVSVTYPAWCKVIVKRQLANGQIVEFAAVERWKENYATSGRDTEAPNAMWRKRPYGQLAKCAEAQALRKAFPEVGAAPTAEEMEGKQLEDEPRDITQKEREPQQPAQLPPCANFNDLLNGWKKGIEDGRLDAQTVIDRASLKYQLTPEQIKTIQDLEPIEGEIQQ